MSKPKAAAVAAANEQTNEQINTSPAPVMQVLKPEAEPETETAKPTFNVYDVKRKVQELNHLSEKHDNLLEQLDKLQAFAAECGENSTLRLTSDGVHSFTSKDPEAVKTMVDICTRNIHARIAEVEKQLID